MGLPHLVRVLSLHLRACGTYTPRRPVIHFLFLGTVIYQFLPNGKKVIIDSIS
ncbi:hypothetical protein HYPSUDRAFT_34833 [Hypholoma sublateritium FD-334 SS-4]|uniref:Uncharacterized protein n=1 Tax=Hypholoma sublateritium (strain FD-334 SS-4) TaxID=945553 RepID=A0A0D2Q7N1_HYPSF|nr:hypothetical protein HYPSUDRAFT_34833 [Hypholoma sublateritium FD-334 SS-4]